MSRKQEELLLPSAQRQGVHFTLAPALSKAMIETRGGEYMLEQAGTRALRMAIEADLATFAMGQAALLKGHGGRVFSNSCTVLDDIAAGVQGTASGKYVGEFHHLLKDKLAEQVLDIDSVAVRQMSYEVSTSLPSERPKDDRSAIERFLFPNG